MVPKDERFIGSVDTFIVTVCPKPARSDESVLPFARSPNTRIPVGVPAGLKPPPLTTAPTPPPRLCDPPGRRGAVGVICTGRGGGGSPPPAPCASPPPPLKVTTAGPNAPPFDPWRPAA